MSEPGNADFHFWLTRSVGRSIGLNFSKAMDEGRLTPEGYMTLLHACQACPHVASCQHWLADRRGPGATPRAPGFCPNKGALDALKPH